MRGYRCERKAGWDTHGLPVEVEVCKELGIHSKEEIETYGIEPFIQKCQQSVWRYMQEWERLTERIGFWVDLKNAYATYHQSYVESVWWSLKNLFDRGLLYQGHKIVWWWAQGGTALSAGEVGQGYREVADPSVYVKFPLLDDAGDVTDTSLLVWTTTPWTLPGNQFAAVHPDLDYLFLEDQDTHEKLVVASERMDHVVQRGIHPSERVSGPVVELDKGPVEATPKYSISNVVKGHKLIGRRYRPPFTNYFDRHRNVTSTDIQSNEIQTYWRILAADFVTVDSGTGVVHIAPSFGEADYDLMTHERVTNIDPNEVGLFLLCPVEPDGRFNSEAPSFCRGRWVKDCDKDIIRDLKQRGLLFHQEQYRHEYPFCWRAEQDPLIQYPRQSWFIRTSNFKDEMLANNAKINWLPEHIKTGRFGKFLETNVDWALSRERYWGTPLPIWKCQETGKMEAVGSYDELMAKPGVTGGEVWKAAKKKNPDLPDDLQVHKPYIDEITYDSPFAKGARMRRVPEVIDCWYDSGAMPFAQWGYRGEVNSNSQSVKPSGSLPLTGRAGEGGEARASAAERFHQQFPADFISEAIDQTRGWFYSQLAISTLLFGEKNDEARMTNDENDHSTFDIRHSSFPYPHPFKNCIVLGHMLGEDGGKMSKSKRNYREPNEIFDRYGADALRWYFFANQPPWTSIRYNEQAIKDSIPEFLLRLWNVYSFFVIYANIDGFDPAVEERASRSEKRETHSRPAFLAPHSFSAMSYRPIADRSELDRWILSELNRTCAAVIDRMDAYDNYGACQRITEFVDALSNWYVRRSRDRFWAADKRGVEKLDAYWTLYEALVTTTKLVAPFVPFIAETMWQNLAGVFKKGTGSELGAIGAGKQVSREVPVPSLNTRVPESVHLCDYPSPDPAVIDEALSERMNLVRLIASLGRNARNAATLKVRQPLAKVQVILADTRHQSWLEEHASVIEEELNVKQLEFCDDPAQYVEHEVVPNFKLLGPRLGKLLPKVKQWLGQQTGADLLANIRDNRKIDLTLDGQAIALTRDEVEFRIHPRPGWTAANGQGVVVVLSTELTPELIAEGLARDIVRLVQDIRKDISCEYTDRIEVGLVTEGADSVAAIQKFRDYIAGETLADRIIEQPMVGVEPVRVKVLGDDFAIYVRVVK